MFLFTLSTRISFDGLFHRPPSVHLSTITVGAHISNPLPYILSCLQHLTVHLVERCYHYSLLQLKAYTVEEFETNVILHAYK